MNIAKNKIVKYNGKSYKVRTIEVRDNIEGQVLTSTITIAPIALNEAYNEKKMSEHGSDEQKLDASIDHYVTNDVLESIPSVVTQNDVAEVIMDIMVCSGEQW